MHYKHAYDLAELFSIPYVNYGEQRTRYFPLQFTAEILLGTDPNSSHVASADALYSVMLYNKFYGPRNAKVLKQAKHKLRQGKSSQARKPQIGSRIDDVCCAAFRPSECICGQPQLSVLLADPSAPNPYPIVRPTSTTSTA